MQPGNVTQRRGQGGTNVPLPFFNFVPALCQRTLNPYRNQLLFNLIPLNKMALLQTKFPVLEIERYSNDGVVILSRVSFNGRDLCHAFEAATTGLPCGQYKAFPTANANHGQTGFRLITHFQSMVFIKIGNFYSTSDNHIRVCMQTNKAGGERSTQAMEAIKTALAGATLFEVHINSIVQTLLK